MNESFKLKNEDHYSVIVATVSAFILLVTIYSATTGFSTFFSPYVWGIIIVTSSLVWGSLISHFRPKSRWRFIPLSIAMLVYLIFTFGFAYFYIARLIDDVPNKPNDFIRVLGCALLLWDCKRRIKKCRFRICMG